MGLADWLMLIVLVFQSQGWIRKSHGTGMGHSSSVGYWIPKKPTGIVPQSRVVHSSRKRKGGGTGLGRGRPSTVSRTKIAKPAAQEVLEELAVSDADGDHTMEEVAVSCSSLPIPSKQLSKTDISSDYPSLA